MSIFSFTVFGIHIAPTWYGLMYALGFMAGYFILRSRKCLIDQELDSLMLFVFFGVILGGRLGYILFYDPSYYLAHPIDIFKTWNGGMSFHGGAIGVVTAMYLFARRYKKSFLAIADDVTSVLPIGLGLWRLGNYINGELLGFAPYAWPLAIIDRSGTSHFPSTILECALEWVVLFAILFWVMRHRKFPGQVAMYFLVWYGVLRFFAEFFRLPDPQIGYLAWGWLTMWQALSVPMILTGGLLWLIYHPSYKSRPGIFRWKSAKGSQGALTGPIEEQS